MGYRKIGYIEQLWYTAKYAVKSFFEWQDAKYWARQLHPAWYKLATKCRNMETRKSYKIKILIAYKEYDKEVRKWEKQN